MICLSLSIAISTSSAWAEGETNYGVQGAMINEC